MSNVTQVFLAWLKMCGLSQVLVNQDEIPNQNANLILIASLQISASDLKLQPTTNAYKNIALQVGKLSIGIQPSTPK